MSKAHGFLRPACLPVPPPWQIITAFYYTIFLFLTNKKASPAVSLCPLNRYGRITTSEAEHYLPLPKWYFPLPKARFPNSPALQVNEASFLLLQLQRAVSLQRPPTKTPPPENLASLEQLRAEGALQIARLLHW